MTAEREYLEELKAHPDSYKAAFNLVASVRAGRPAVAADRRIEAVDRGQPRLRGGAHLPGEVLPRQPMNLDEAATLAKKGLGLNPRADVVPPRALHPGRYLQQAGRRGEAAQKQHAAVRLEARQRRAAGAGGVVRGGKARGQRPPAASRKKGRRARCPPGPPTSGLPDFLPRTTTRPPTSPGEVRPGSSAPCSPHGSFRTLGPGVRDVPVGTRSDVITVSL